MTPPQAYMIRCSARFLSEGFTTTRFVDAFKNISDDDGGGSSSIKAMAIFKFNSPAAMDLARKDCQQSGSLGMIQLASIADIATFIVHEIGGSIPDIEDIYDPETGELDQDILADLVFEVSNNSGNDEELGEKAIQLAEVMCSGAAGKQDTSLCKDIDQAIAEAGADLSNPTAIGEKLRGLLK